MTSYSQYAGDEFWKPSYKEAEACKDLDALLEVGLGLYKSIRRYTNGKEIDGEILDLLVWWLGPCAIVEKHILHFEGLGYNVEGAIEFRRDCEEARKLASLVPTTWRGQRIYTEEELQKIDFPYPPEPD